MMPIPQPLTRLGQGHPELRSGRRMKPGRSGNDDFFSCLLCRLHAPISLSYPAYPTTGLVSKAVVDFSPYITLSVIAALGNWSIITILMA